jgi:hypothetical protein
VRAVIDAPGRDVDRQIPDQADPALGCVAAQCVPLALEPDLIGDAAAEPLPRSDPVRVPLAELVQLRP